MYPHPITLLVLGLCLGPVIRTQKGVLHKPSLRAEPGPVTPRGQPLIFVCQGPAEAKLFRLEKGKSPVGSDLESVSHDGSQGTEARFLIPVVRKVTAGRYRCVYHQGRAWSVYSDPLNLQVTEDDVYLPPSGALPKPTLRAEPGPVIPQGWPVTFVCNSPFWAKGFHLEKDGIAVPADQKPQGGFPVTEASFLIPVVREDNAGRYRCLYHQGSDWSEPSEPLQLQVTEEDVSTPTSGDTRNQSLDSTIQGLQSKYVYVFGGTSMAFLLCLLLLVLLLVRCQRLRKHKSPHSKADEQRPQERLSTADGITESIPEEAMVYALPEKKRKPQSPSPAAGDAQEVTYAELDQRALTLRAAQAVSPPPTEPTAAASTYAELPRR